MATLYNTLGNNTDSYTCTPKIKITGEGTEVIINGSYLTPPLYNVLQQFIGEKNDYYTRARIENYIKMYNTASGFYDSIVPYADYMPTSPFTAADTDVTTTGVCTYSNYSNSITFPFIENFPFLENPSEQKKTRLKNNLIIHVKTRANININIPKNEQCALETLREMISETEFRKYMKYGFVLIKGKSGNTYQLFRNKAHTKVWRNGKIIEEVCVRLKERGIPPTDNVIAFKTMIETDEQEFKNMGNVYKMAAAA